MSDYFFWKKGEKIQFTKNFSSSEFECKCKNTDCIEQKINKNVVEKIQKIRDEHGRGINVNSGLRCLKHNRAIGSSDTSQHIKGDAVDISSSDLNSLYSLCEKYFKAVGDGRKKGFVHVDAREDKIRRWNY